MNNTINIEDFWYEINYLSCFNVGSVVAREKKHIDNCEPVSIINYYLIVKQDNQNRETVLFHLPREFIHGFHAPKKPSGAYALEKALSSEGDLITVSNSIKMLLVNGSFLIEGVKE